jgi:PPK2 family polyphosphate:nucleotide phosphotransferase
MKIDRAAFVVREGETVDLTKRPTRTEPLYASKSEYQSLLDAELDRLRDLQKMLYAADSHALLVVLQGMDAAGKDGVIRHVLSGLNPQGCEVHPFKQPSEEELRHDFLWRAYHVLPARGRIGVFNRSYYEEVLIVRVHPELLIVEGLKADAREKHFWRGRYRAIVEMERHLGASCTRVVKFFLHVSAEEQRKRFLARIDEPEKNWKFGPTDVAERAHWNEYMSAYGDCLAATSTSDAPWFIVPADDKQNARLIAATVIRSALEDLDLHYPKVDKKRRSELAEIRRELEKQAGNPSERSDKRARRK